ncbi:hypothetical protein E6A55_32725 (plasmid) [Cupriavidus necator H16]|uniref:Uncharacterized protein n=1 Tax=Cupriavidus necator (strain ATCC 17699 / DSM 428 / KCTC 22496 / NCIMB 10442 / H16 / Stanier 337) TaxID=381666 RepID=A0AAF1D5B0_CUPNH|nr:hypothetical protein E6A55_32725 [Cupriavidus necator H16]
MGNLNDLVSDPRLNNYARRLGVKLPLEVGLTQWKGRVYYHVSGVHHDGRRFLIEVFRTTASGNLEAIMAFEYPPPIRDLDLK